jgi:hypothetical protein
MAAGTMTAGDVGGGRHHFAAGLRPESAVA